MTEADLHQAKAPIRAVLFDIDDTLVDLRAANHATAVEASNAVLHAEPGVTGPSAATVSKIADHFVADAAGHYDAYLRGELSFEGQRVQRAKAAFTAHGLHLNEGQAWNAHFEALAPTLWKTFDDVTPMLDALDEAGVRYGALSNNVHEYQRMKLDAVGLSRIEILVGIDAVGAAKPEPQIFAEGVRRLSEARSRELGKTELTQLTAADVLYVGDNPDADARGARHAGLQAALLDRGGRFHDFEGAVIRSLAEVPNVVRKSVWN